MINHLDNSAEISTSSTPCQDLWALASWLVGPAAQLQRTNKQGNHDLSKGLTITLNCDITIGFVLLGFSKN